MDRNKEILVEQTLFRAISLFHEIDDAKTRNKSAKEYFVKFCQENDIDLNEAFEILSRMFEEKRAKTIFEYEHYKGDNLSKILLDEDQKRNKRGDKKSEKPEER